MDELEKKYQDQINTLQKAIKTQNEVLINKIQTIINQSTLEVFQTLERNFAEFRQNYREIRDFKQQDNQFINYEYIQEEIQNYANLNLRTLREQISNSIGGLQENKQVTIEFINQTNSYLDNNCINNDQQVSSLLDVMQLLLKAAELYSQILIFYFLKILRKLTLYEKLKGSRIITQSYQFERQIQINIIGNRRFQRWKNRQNNDKWT